MKKCSRCGETKEDSKFSKHCRSKDGLQSWCKQCRKDYYNEDRGRFLNDLDEYREKKGLAYRSWENMIQRCINPKYTNYKYWGGRGIKVDSCFIGNAGYKRFLKEVGDRPSKRYTIDRIDNDGDYTPGNIKWSTYKEQASNRRPRGTV